MAGDIGSVPLLDLKLTYAGQREEILSRVTEVFDNQYFILGKNVSEFEKGFAGYCGAPAGVGISSGTDALLVALMAEDVGPGDEVITSPFTFFATIGVIERVGARPVFADIKGEDYNIDPAAIEEAITSRTKAIMPVHLFGQCADMDPISTMASNSGLFVIEDAAQAAGASLNGKRAGVLGEYGCFSFFPSKNLGGAGDGGFITVRDEASREKVAQLRNHGSKVKYYHTTIGGNFRLDELQAAVLNVKLRKLDEWHEARRKNADIYRRMIAGRGLEEFVSCAAELPGRYHTYNQFAVRVKAGREKRDALREVFKAKNIGHDVYYPVPAHLQDIMVQKHGYRAGQFPVAEKASAEIINIPIFPGLTGLQIEYVVDAMESFFKG